MYAVVPTIDMTSGENMDEGNMNGSDAPAETSSADTLKSNGFAWSGGQERQTTGMWMWSEPFFRKISSYPEEIAILLMDTQGMFDNETTMSLTARIFGLSTLISSYQVITIDIFGDLWDNVIFVLLVRSIT